MRSCAEPRRTAHRRLTSAARSCCASCARVAPSRSRGRLCRKIRGCKAGQRSPVRWLIGRGWPELRGCLEHGLSDAESSLRSAIQPVCVCHLAFGIGWRLRRTLTLTLSLTQPIGWRLRRRCSSTCSSGTTRPRALALTPTLPYPYPNPSPNPAPSPSPSPNPGPSPNPNQVLHDVWLRGSGASLATGPLPGGQSGAPLLASTLTELYP